MKEVSGKGIPRVIAINSGLPRSGKTAFAMNLAIVLAKKGKKVLLFNLDMKLLHLDSNEKHVGRVIKKECRFEDAVINGPWGLEIIPSWPENEKPLELTTIEKINLMTTLEDFGKRFDFILMDIGNERSEAGLFMTIMAGEVVFVSTRDRESISSACSLMRVLCGLGVTSFKLAINNVTSKKEGLNAYGLASELADGMPASVSYLGSIIEDQNLLKAEDKGLSTMIYDPKSVASINFGEIADWICIEPVRGIRGGLQLFWQEEVTHWTEAKCSKESNSSVCA